MTGRLREKLRAMQDRAALWIVCREHQSFDARQADRAGAHRAGLERDVERRSRQPLIAELRGSGAQHELLGVRGRVPPLNNAIAVGGQHHAVAGQQHGTDRYFAASGSGLGFLERECYGFIVIHAGPEEFEKD